jgi:hypothetical protein
MKYVPLKAELIEEGNFLQNINGALLKAQNQFITMVRANKGKCKGMTAKVQATVTLKLESVECPDTRSIVVSVSAADLAAVRYQAFEKLIGELKPIAEKLKCIVALGRVGQGEWETLEVKP